MKRVLLITFTLTICLLLGVPASAAVYSISNGNSSFAVEDCASGCTQGQVPGMISWTIDGVEALYEQWFWYRVGANGGEKALNTLTLEPVTSDPNAGILDMTYVGQGFEIAVRYSLAGGQAGSRTADISEQIRINNTGGRALDFHFFQYSDFDLDRVNGDRVTIDPTLRVADQTPAGPGGLLISETTLNPKPSHAEAAISGSTLASLNDSAPTTLNDHLTAGPGDATWAFEWDKQIAAGGSFVISKDKIIAPAVPEPASVALLGGLLLLISKKLWPRVV